MFKKIAGLLLILLAQSAVAQKISVSGQVKDNVDPLPGTNIQIKGTTNGTVTDFDGNFTLEIDKGDVLIFSFIGYLPQEITPDGSGAIQVILLPDATEMEEVVVIGYGFVKKSDLTGSVTSLKSEEILNTVVSSIDQGLQGKAAGVVVTQESGAPGSGSSIRIRGTTSIYGSNEPLYVVDGIPIVYDESSTTYATKGPSFNPLNSINPNDIKSVEILKDASATAIYGARGAAGVVLITTKTGEDGKASINLSVNTGVQQVANAIPMLNAAELAILANEAADNAGVPRKVIFASPINLGEGTDWQDEIFRLAPITNIQAGVSGGKDGTSYLISASYFNQDGIVLGSDYKRANFRINFNTKLTDKLKLGTNINLNRGTLNGVVTGDEGAFASSVTSWALEFNPGLSVYESNGEYVYENNIQEPSVGNPVADAKENKQVNTTNRIIGNLNLQWQIIDGLVFKTMGGIDAYFNKDEVFTPNFLKRAESSNGSATVAISDGYTWLIENTLAYNKEFNNQSLNAIVGYTVQAYKGKFLLGATSDFDDNRLGYNAIQAGKDKTLLINGTSGTWQMQSFLGRANYILSDKYLITASLRVDGSSKFGKDNRYGAFPSAAFAWRINNENFLKNSDNMSELKLRLGYGTVGNEGIPPYSKLGLLEITEAYFGETEIAKGAGAISPQNDKLKWETTHQFDVGIDLGLFKQRVLLTVDFYYKNTVDLLLYQPVPYTSGFKNVFNNVGDMTNKGIELALNTVNTTKKVNWETSFNFAINRNEITKLTQDARPIPSSSILGINGWSQMAEGEPIGSFYGYETDGIIQLGENISNIPYFSNTTPSAGDRKYIDQNNDGIIDLEDKVYLGTHAPKFSFGLGNVISYKNFSLNIFIQGSVGNKLANFNKFTLESFDGTKNNSATALERWTPENPSNEYPRANATPIAFVFSDVHVENASYIRLKDITLNYSFDSKFISKAKLKNAKIFFSVKNAITITNYTGYDPEANRAQFSELDRGADYGVYPQAMLFTGGINLTF